MEKTQVIFFVLKTTNPSKDFNLILNSPLPRIILQFSNTTIHSLVESEDREKTRIENVSVIGVDQCWSRKSNEFHKKPKLLMKWKLTLTAK